MTKTCFILTVCLAIAKLAGWLSLSWFVVFLPIIADIIAILVIWLLVYLSCFAWYKSQMR